MASLNYEERIAEAGRVCKERERKYLERPLSRGEAIARLKVIRERLGWCLTQSVEGTPDFVEIDGRLEHRHIYDRRLRKVNRIIAQLDCHEIHELHCEVVEFMLYGHHAG